MNCCSRVVVERGRVQYSSDVANKLKAQQSTLCAAVHWTRKSRPLSCCLSISGSFSRCTIGSICSRSRKRVVSNVSCICTELMYCTVQYCTLQDRTSTSSRRAVCADSFTRRLVGCCTFHKRVREILLWICRTRSRAHHLFRSRVAAARRMEESALSPATPICLLKSQKARHEYCTKCKLEIYY